MKTLTTIMLSLVIIATATTVMAEPLVIAEVQSTYADGAPTVTPNIYILDHFEDARFGVQAFAAVTGGWAELYAGPTYAPTDWLELSVMAGVQSIGSSLEARYAASAWAGNEAFDTLWWVEWDHLGTNSVWYDAFVRYQVLDPLRVGVRFSRFVGSGPTVWTSIPNTPIGAWVTWAPIGFEEESSPARFRGGIQYTF